MTATRTYRIGQIVPSSNTTMETEIPAMLRARESIEPERFTFHSSRMRMKKVTKEELAAMDADSDRCAAELADARVDVIGYACLVAIMSMGQGYHRASQGRLQEVTQRETGGCIPVVTSAGALVDSLQALGAKRIAMIAPYVESLTCTVADYIEAYGIEVVDSLSLSVDVPEAVRSVNLALFDLAGRKVRVLVDGHLSAGRHVFRWDGTAQSGGRAAPGIYVVRLAGGGRTIIRRATLLP